MSGAPPVTALRRGIAFLIDVVVAGGPFVLVATWVGLQGLGTLFHHAASDEPLTLGLWIAGGWGVSYMLLRDTPIAGRSIGRRITDLRVVSDPSRPGALLARNAFTLVLLCVPLILVLEGLLVIFADGRRLADRIAATHVARAS